MLDRLILRWLVPEGKSHDENHVVRVKSDVSRIAIQAVEAGMKGLLILLVEINHQCNERVRSGLWIQFGNPMDVERWLEDHGGESRGAMRALNRKSNDDCKRLSFNYETRVSAII